MTSKHTPGPWSVRNDHGDTVVVSAERPFIATVHQGFHATTEANARLIAAAPDLYAVVAAVIKATRDYMPPDGITKDEFINRVIAATDNPQIVAALQQIES